MSEAATKESQIFFKASQELELRATPLRLSRFATVFELYGPSAGLRLSEALRCFRITSQGHTLYAGKAVVRSLVETGPIQVCEVALDEAAWLNVVFDAASVKNGRFAEQFKGFLAEWQKTYLVRPEYKVLVADMQTFFAELRQWLQPIELGIAGQPAADRASLEREAGEILAAQLLPCVNTLFEQFEHFIRTLPPEVLPAHHSYMRRQMHPLVLCSPFAHRTFTKPLGYAGDYEMVNMMLRDGWEGESLFAKVVNLLLVRQCPAQAHRNRIAYLVERLRDETMRVRSAGRLTRVYNLACGPAHEVQEFVRQSPLADATDFTLVDFNEETLVHLTARLSAVKSQSGRQTPMRFIQKSVYQLLKESGSGGKNRPAEPYDLIYCAGLFDYLPDQACQRLTETMYDWLAPGGLLIVTNVEPSNPVREGLEHLLDWHLIYRSGQELLRLKPPQAPADGTRALAEPTGVNLFLEVRKPANV